MKLLGLYFITFISFGLFGQVVTTTNGATTYQSVVAASSNSIIYNSDLSIQFLPISTTTATTITATGANYFHAYIKTANNCAELKTELDGSYYLPVDNILCFKFEEKYTEGTLTYQIYDFQRNIKSPSLSVNQNIPKIYGTKYYTLNLNDVGFALVKDQFYTLEVTGSKGELLKLRFKYLQHPN